MNEKNETLMMVQAFFISKVELQTVQWEPGVSKVQNSIVKCFLGVKICNSTCLCNQRLDDNDDDHDAS